MFRLWARCHSAFASANLAFAAASSASPHATQPSLLDFGGVHCVVKLCQGSAFLDPGTEVDRLAAGVRVGAEARDHADRLGADIDHLLRFDCSRSADRRHEVAGVTVAVRNTPGVALSADTPTTGSELRPRRRSENARCTHRRFSSRKMLRIAPERADGRSSS